MSFLPAEVQYPPATCVDSWDRWCPEVMVHILTTIKTSLEKFKGKSRVFDYFLVIFRISFFLSFVVVSFAKTQTIPQLVSGASSLD